MADPGDQRRARGRVPELTIRPDPEPGSAETETPNPDLAGLATLTLDGEDGEAPSADIQLRGLIGQGGMGVVQSALQRSLQRDVAVKQLLPHAAQPRLAFPRCCGPPRSSRPMFSRPRR